MYSSPLAETSAKRTFRALKCVLISSSDVFYEIFCENKDTDTIDVPDIFPEAFENMLRYIYTDEIDVTVEDALATMKCAEQYDLPPLAGHCLDSILRDLHASDQNCLRHLEKALTLAFAGDSVLENCWHYVDVHCEKILKSEQFNELPLTTLRMILAG
ncbi:BTB/POZ domain-containing protein 3-like [Paramacrobiotus metropolitanus]|uniref:BTB/POZ domain-containing protein 3-like n=1 Tax=Paramacrobiotus metropolitanus TaxID=2943436 RepID=UPI0024464D7D|nr:BTB/POZ domain-containing protein 3-like [Paramacrobiotus metropolitanus]